MSKQYSNGSSLNEKILKGMNTLADNVGTTLGPKGRNVILYDKKQNIPVITKDGVTIAKFVELDDPFENVGVQILKQAAEQSANKAGDGTTTTGAIGSVGIGKSSLNNLTSGAGNTAVGYQSLDATTTGARNTALGYQTLTSLTGYSDNTAIGYNALDTGTSASHNTAVGSNAGDVIETGDYNTIIGSGADPSGNNGQNQIVIGYNATGQVDNSVVLGNSSVTDVYASQDGGAFLHATGIKFPATQNASSDANALDDYEEGTWTAGISFDGSGASGSLSTSFDTGTYTKIGRVVHVQGFFALASVSSPSGNLFITGLPFTSASGSEGTEFPAVSIRMTELSSAIIGAPQGFVNSGSTQIQIERFRQDTTNGGSDRQIGAFIGATTTILISGTYFV